MTILVKIMSGQEMADGNNTKDFRMVAIPEYESFKFVRNPVTGISHLIVGEGDNGPGIRYPITGNAYVTDGNKTISVYGYTRTSYNESVENIPGHIGHAKQLMGENKKFNQLVGQIMGSLNSLPLSEFREIDTSFEFPHVVAPETAFNALRAHLWQYNLYCEFYSTGEKVDGEIHVGSGYACYNEETPKLLRITTRGINSQVATKPKLSGNWDNIQIKDAVADLSFFDKVPVTTTRELYTATSHDPQFSEWIDRFIACGGDAAVAGSIMNGIMCCYGNPAYCDGALYTLVIQPIISENDERAIDSCKDLLPFDVSYQKESDPVSGLVKISGIHIHPRR